MNPTEFAVIADVHGNAWALEAVLADIQRRGIRSIINLGDNANGPLAPARCIKLLRAAGGVHVRGNGDRMTGEGGPGVRGSAAFARERLDEASLRWLRELPEAIRGDDWIAFHATPRSDTEYFLENISAGKTVLASRDEIAARLGKTSGVSLVLCGHTHVPRLVRLGNEVVIVNPGSVGLPAYSDDAPVLHVVETGSPDARYAIVRRGAAGWEAQFIALPYDWTTAAEAARAAGWTAWAHNLETGFC